MKTKRYTYRILTAVFAVIMLLPAAFPVYAGFIGDDGMCVVEFDSGDGMGGPSEAYVNPGDTFVIPPEEPSYNGGAFLGWSASPDFNMMSFSVTNVSNPFGSLYMPGDTVRVNESAVLYARYSCSHWRWEVSDMKNYSETLHYAETYCEDCGKLMETNYYEHKKENTYSSMGPAGHTVNTICNKCDYLKFYSESHDYEVTSTETEITYTCVKCGYSYTDSLICVISYDANGGTGAPPGQIKLKSASVKLSETVPSRTGYEFKGWSLSPSGTVSYMPGDTYSGTGSITLYAVWNCIHPSTKRVNVSGCTYEIRCAVCDELLSKGTEHIGFTYGDWTYKDESLHEREKRCLNNDYSEYEYAGHTTDTKYEQYSSSQHLKYRYCSICKHSAGPSSYENHSYTTEKVSGKTVYTCSKCGYSYEESDRYDVTYDLRGGTGAVSTQTKIHGTNLVLSDVVPQKTGFSFEGYSISPDGEAVYAPGDEYTDNAPVTLYAVWSCDHIESERVFVTGCHYEDRCTYCHTVLDEGDIHPDFTYSDWEYFSISKHKRIKTCINADYSEEEYGAHNTVTVYEQYDETEHKYYEYCEQCRHSVGAESLESHTFVSSRKTGKTVYTCKYCKHSYDVYDEYCISFNANGGTGAPDAVYKTHGTDLKLPDTEPSRDWYVFKGWSSSSSGSAEYASGDTYTADSPVTLYAVWERVYATDFKIVSLESDKDEYYEGDTGTVTVTIENGDNNSYGGVLVNIIYDDTVIYSTRIDLSPYEKKEISTDFGVGNTPGDRTLKAEINGDSKYSENGKDDNSKTLGITVKENMKLKLEFLDPYASYTEDTDVIISFYVRNMGEKHVKPDEGIKLNISCYVQGFICFEGQKSVIVPKGDRNLVTFRVHVPERTGGMEMLIEAELDPDGKIGVHDEGYTGRYYVDIDDPVYSVMDDPAFTTEAPASYHPGTGVPQESLPFVSWKAWVYENGEFIKKTYAVMNGDTPVFKSAPNVPTSYFDTVLHTKSGYGIMLEYKADLKAVAGYSAPDESMVTGIQNALAFFPETDYSNVLKKFRSLEYKDGNLVFPENRNIKYERIHYIPVYVKDGGYTVSLIMTDVWTPMGKITYTVNAGTIMIEGSVYDDRYTGN